MKTWGVVTIGDFLEKSPLWSRRDKVRLRVAFIDHAIFAVWPHCIRLNDEQSVFVDFTNAITVHAINLAMIKRITFKPVTVWERWHEDLQMDGLEELWPSIVNIRFQFLQVKHQTFYWRYLYCGYVTNKMLFKANLHSNDRCSFCDREVETFKHLYWDCNIVQSLWVHFIEWCKLNVDCSVVYNVKTCLLMGFGNVTLNIIMMYFKYFIHISRLFNLPLTFQWLMARLASARKNEFMIFNHLPYLYVYKCYARWGLLDQNAVFDVT